MLKKNIAGETESTRIVADHQFYTEGPVASSDGKVFFTDLSGNAIYELSDGIIKQWAACPCPNGQILLPGGDHLVCSSSTASLRRFNPAGHFIGNDIEGSCAGWAIKTPNDLLIDSSGNIYFSDSVRQEGRVFCYSSTGEQKVVIGQLDYPNGLALSDDDRWLYISESYRNRILKVDLQQGDDGTVVLIDLPSHPSGHPACNLPDGLTLDGHGNIWVAHYGMGAIHCISSGGELLRSLPTGIPLTSNLVFASPQKMIVTGGWREPGPGAVISMSINENN